MKPLKPFLGLSLILSLIAIMYFPTLIWLFERYIAVDSYYSHGFIIPIVSIFLIWLKRKDYLQNLKKEFSCWGLILIVFALLTNLISVWAEFFFVSGLSIIALFFGICLFLYGKKITKKLVFPIFFLIFMIPLPLVIINSISFPMKMLVTNSAVFILKTIFNIPVSNEGFQIFFPKSTLIVENPCSGLRSLISMLALGSIFAFLLKAHITKRIGLFLSSIPIALLTNLFRIIILSLAVFIYGNDMTSGFFHDFTGYLTFGIAFLVLHLLWRKLQ